MKKMKKKSTPKSKPLTDEQRKKRSDIRHLEVCLFATNEQVLITTGDLQKFFENQALRLALQLKKLQE